MVLWPFSYPQATAPQTRVNKRDDSSSDLYSLFDYKDFREKMDLEKAYLQGRFDAVPYINEFESI